VKLCEEMPKRSLCTMLPEEIRQELNRKLIENNFSRYCELESWLGEQGFSVSYSSIHRYGKDFSAQIEAMRRTTEQAKAIAEVLKDEQNDLADALCRLVQHKAFEALINEDSKLPLDKLGAMISSLNRASVTVRKYQDQVREKAQVAADEIAASVKQRGLSDEVACQIRAKILGIL
jgi:hypothetical protein